MKALVRQSHERTIAEQFAAEAQSLGSCAATEDFVEAINAFIEKTRGSVQRTLNALRGDVHAAAEV